MNKQTETNNSSSPLHVETDPFDQLDTGPLVGMPGFLDYDSGERYAIERSPDDEIVICQTPKEPPQGVTAPDARLRQGNWTFEQLYNEIIGTGPCEIVKFQNFTAVRDQYFRLFAFSKNNIESDDGVKLHPRVAGAMYSGELSDREEIWTTLWVALFGRWRSPMSLEASPSNDNSNHDRRNSIG